MGLTVEMVVVVGMGVEDLLEWIVNGTTAVEPVMFEARDLLDRVV